MRKKGTLRTSGSLWGGWSGEVDTNVDSSLRQTVIEQQWHNYRATNDLECLAQICEHADFFGNREISDELAVVLRGLSRKRKGYTTDLLWEQACSLYNLLSCDPDWDRAPQDAKRRRVAELIGFPKEQEVVDLFGGGSKDLDNWSERFRKQIEKRGQTK